MSFHSIAQTNYVQSKKHDLEMDSILQTATYDYLNNQIIINYGVWKNMVPYENGWMVYDYNDGVYRIKKKNKYYFLIEEKKKYLKINCMLMKDKNTHTFNTNVNKFVDK